MHRRTTSMMLACLSTGTAVKEQDCMACSSLETRWRTDRCKRFSLLRDSGIATMSFEGRHGHASAVYPLDTHLAIWVIGGRGEWYPKWNFRETSRRADVWLLLDNAALSWSQQRFIHGDFHSRNDIAFLMEDVSDPGDVAPFWERYGHSLDALSAMDKTGEPFSASLKLLVLCGGFTPRPDNDVRTKCLLKLTPLTTSVTLISVSTGLGVREWPRMVSSRIRTMEWTRIPCIRCLQGTALHFRWFTVDERCVGWDNCQRQQSIFHAMATSWYCHGRLRAWAYVVS